MTNWDWPQYVLAFWWGGLFFMMIGVQIVKPVSGKKLGSLTSHWFGIALLSWILYMDGFWQ